MLDRQFHPLANIFPLMSGVEYDDLVADIGEHGLRDSITLTPEGEILDGRNRFRACKDSGVEPVFVTTDLPEDEWPALVISLNLKRRHLNESQRAMVAAKLANLNEGRPSKTVPIGTVSWEQAGDMLNVGRRSVARAKEVEREGAPELVERVERGEVSVSAAADVATLPREQQVEIVAKGEREILEAAKRIRAEKADKRRDERLEKIAEISRGNTELNTETKYPIIYADPPWRYESAPMGSPTREIENHYPTMSLDEICALPVGDLAHEDAILYIWATAPKLAECLKVVEAWGFEYRTNLVWDKEKIGMGYYARSQHELLLVCRRGQFPPPKPGTQPSSVYREARGEHSAKPEFYYEMIEAAYPGLPKIELFCRSPRDGWAVWGNQSGEAA